MPNDSSVIHPSYAYIESRLHRDISILVRDGTIKEIRPAGEPFDLPGVQVEEWPGLLMLPGTVNSHCHSFQSLLRGFVADVPFLEWRDHALYRYAPYLDTQAIYAGAVLAFSEMLRCGVTTVADFFYVHQHGTEDDEAVIQAARDVGIRLVLARAMYDWNGAPEAFRETTTDAVSRTRTLMIKYAGDDTVTVCPAPHSLHGAGHEMIRSGHALAREFGTRFHIHVAEERFQVEAVLSDQGCLPIELLQRLGVLDGSMVAVHLCWLEDSEIEMAGGARISLAYCPSSNMFLADGVTSIPTLVSAGVTTALGTDGACSNNRSSVFEEMRMIALLQKVSTLDASTITASQAFDMGTENGGKVLNLLVGQITPGFRADFVGVRLNDLSMQPGPRPESAILRNVVYGMQPTAIEKVVVGGRGVVSGGQLQRISERRILDIVERAVSHWPVPAA